MMSRRFRRQAGPTPEVLFLAVLASAVLLLLAAGVDLTTTIANLAAAYSTWRAAHLHAPGCGTTPNCPEHRDRHQ